MCVPAGDEQRLIALLRERGSTSLFNAALRRVPIIQMLALLDVLPRHMGEGSKLSGSSGSGSGGGAASRSSGSELSSMRSISSSSGEPSDTTSSGDSGGSSGGTWRVPLRPDDATARILLDRLPASELHWELDSALDKLLAAGIKPHYHLFLPWATLHANVSPQGRCGSGRCDGRDAQAAPLPAMWLSQLPLWAPQSLNRCSHRCHAGAGGAAAGSAQGDGASGAVHGHTGATLLCAAHQGQGGLGCGCACRCPRQRWVGPCWVGF